MNRPRDTFVCATTHANKSEGNEKLQKQEQRLTGPSGARPVDLDAVHILPKRGFFLDVVRDRRQCRLPLVYLPPLFRCLEHTFDEDG